MQAELQVVDLGSQGEEGQAEQWGDLPPFCAPDLWRMRGLIKTHDKPLMERRCLFHGYSMGGAEGWEEGQ